jgi:hypothetical protein
MPAIPALGRLRQEDREFKASLVYIVRYCLKKPNQPTKQTNTLPNVNGLNSPIKRCRLVDFIKKKNKTQLFHICKKCKDIYRLLRKGWKVIPSKWNLRPNRNSSYTYI